MKHTPGPWHVEPDEYQWLVISDCNYRYVALVGDKDRFADDAANARLIAAAPDLLAACERALGWFEGDYGVNHPETVELRAAIAKATGGAFE
jgi:hypothetical protein